MKQFVLPVNPAITTDDTEISLTGREYHYLIHVRRYSAGDRIPALSPDGRTYEMRILNVKKDSCSVGVQPLTRNPDTKEMLRIRITLMPGITKGRKMDLTVRQAVEAGAFAIWPVLTENCQVKYRNEADTQLKKERWERIAVEALQQCGGEYPTELAPPRKLPELLEIWGKTGPLFFLHENEFSSKEAKSLHQHLAEPVRNLAIIVGPEGGLSLSETRLLQEKGAHPIHLGRRILRSETAAIYGLAAIGTIIRERNEWQTV